MNRSCSRRNDRLKPIRYNQIKDCIQNGKNEGRDIQWQSDTAHSIYDTSIIH